MVTPTKLWNSFLSTKHLSPLNSTVCNEYIFGLVIINGGTFLIQRRQEISKISSLTEMKFNNVLFLDHNSVYYFKDNFVTC